MKKTTTQIESEMIVDGDFDYNTVRQYVDAVSNLPLLARVQYAKSLIFDRGGDLSSLPVDPTLVVATEVLRGVIGILEATPAAAALRKPEPKLGTLDS